LGAIRRVLDDPGLDVDDKVFVISENGRVLLAEVGEVLAEIVREEAAELEEGAGFEELVFLGGWLPRGCARNYTPEFVQQFADVVEEVTQKLGSELCYLKSTVEELAGHAIIDYAKSFLEDSPEAAQAWGVKDVEAADHDLEMLADLVFEDEDVLMLFDPRFDGIESSAEGESMGVANLRFEEWFTPFRGQDVQEM
jgi:hypothetical protein